MSEIFYNKNQENLFDELVIDVDKIYSRYPINKKINPKVNRVNLLNKKYSKLYRSSLIPSKIRSLFWHLFRRINIDLSWFNEFKNYWTNVIGGRPLWNLQDLFYLKNLYRTKFQKCQIPDTDDSKIHLEAWQRPELICQ